MSSFDEARAALRRTVRAVFPDAKPVQLWAGIEAWGAPRPAAVVDPEAKGTYDPARTVIGIADRKSGPTVYFLDPGDYFALETHRALLEEAGLKLGRGCIMHTRKGPLPVDALAELFRRVKARDARDARAAKKAPRKKGRTSPQVDAYLAALPADQRAALERLRRQVHAAAPKATEKMAWGMPTFVHQGNLAHMAAFREHLSFFPGTRGVAFALANAPRGLDTSKGTIRFTPKKPIPATLVRKIVKMRVAENEALAAKRAAKKARRRGKAPAKDARALKGRAKAA